MTDERKKWVYPAIAFAFLAIVMGGFGGLFNDKIEPNIIESQKVDGAARTITINAEPTQVFETIPGTLRAREATIISSRILAGIKAIHARAGDRVEVGQLLVELDNQDLIARQNMWQQQVRSFEVRLEQARPHFERVKQLYDEGVSSKADLDRATADYQTALAQLAGAKASSSEAKTAVGFSQIKAPISGRIIDRLAEPGSVASPGMGLLSIYNPITLRVEANVRESLALELNIGDQIEAEIPSAEKKLVTIIEEIIPEAHTGTRSFLIKASIPTDTDLVPGLFVRLHIPTRVENQIHIPNEYINEMGQLNIVWKLINGTAQKQVVTLGEEDSSGNRLLIKGLNDGDTLIHPNSLDD